MSITSKFLFSLILVICCSKHGVHDMINSTSLPQSEQLSSKYPSKYTSNSYLTVEARNDGTPEFLDSNDPMKIVDPWSDLNFNQNIYPQETMQSQYSNISFGESKKKLFASPENVSLKQKTRKVTEENKIETSSLKRNVSSNFSASFSNMPEMNFLSRVRNDNGNKSYTIEEFTEPKNANGLYKTPVDTNQDGFWVGYDNSLSSKNKTMRQKESCLLVGMNAKIIVPIKSNIGQKFNMTIPIPKYASNLDVPCNETSQHMTLSWKRPEPIQSSSKNLDSDIALGEDVDDDIITIYDGMTNLDELEKAFNIEDLQKDARFHMIFNHSNDSIYSKLQNYLSDIFFDVPFNISKNSSIIKNEYDVANHHVMLQTLHVDQDESKENSITLDDNHEKSSSLTMNNYNGYHNEKRNISLRDNSYRMIGVANNLNAMQAPNLFAYYCNNRIIIPMMANVFQTDNRNEDKTLQYSKKLSHHLRHGYKMDSMHNTKSKKAVSTASNPKTANLTGASLELIRISDEVQIFLVFDSLRIEAFRSHRNYAKITHLKWDCLNGWPYGTLGPRIITIFITTFEILLCAVFYLRYRAWKNRCNNFTDISEDAIEDEIEESASFNCDEKSPLLDNEKKT